MSLVSTEWLDKNFDKVKIIDCSWHLPNENRNGQKEYEEEHIPNAIFFDLDKNSEQNTDLPHMLPNKNFWEEKISEMGISNEDQIIIYDNSDVISSCRCWYNFIFFGHDPKLVSVLNGGFEKWKKENRKLTNLINKNKHSNYKTTTNEKMVKNIEQINENILNDKFHLIDARSKERFDGKVPDPRNNVRSGSIPNSICLPYKKVVEEDKTFKDKVELNLIFKSLIKDSSKPIVFSCGSGVTACVLALAYSLVNTKYLPTIYDGSWAEFGKI